MKIRLIYILLLGMCFLNAYPFVAAGGHYNRPGKDFLITRHLSKSSITPGLQNENSLLQLPMIIEDNDDDDAERKKTADTGLYFFTGFTTTAFSQLQSLHFTEPVKHTGIAPCPRYLLFCVFRI